MSLFILLKQFHVTKGGNKYQSKNIVYTLAVLSILAY